MCFYYICLFMLLPLISADGAAGRRPEAAGLKARGGTPLPGGETRLPRAVTPLPPPSFLRLPVFVDSERPLVNPELFLPERSSGPEPLPEAVRRLLVPVGPGPGGPPGPGPGPGSQGPVRTWCRRGRMHVEVDRSVLGPGDSNPRLTLGTCPETRSNPDLVYFEYELNQCGTNGTTIDNKLAYTNTLRYDPPQRQQPIRRHAPFNMSVTCVYNRFQYSYKIGYKPKMQMRKIYKSMKNRETFILTPRNAQWERVSGSGQYLLGEPMFFQAEAPSARPDQRLYVHSCHVSPDRSHKSHVQFPVVKNFGCMVESKDGHSRFVRYRRDTVRFSVDAFLFRGLSAQELYLHCDLSLSSPTPSPTTKSCNYDSEQQRWVEVFGPDRVCSCCESTCRSAASNETKTISSSSWTIEHKVKPTASPKRRPTTTTTTSPKRRRPTTTTSPKRMRPTTTTQAVTQPKTTRATTTPEGRGKNREEEEEEEEDEQWPYGGGGVTWEEGEGGLGEGSAVVVEEEVKGKEKKGETKEKKRAEKVEEVVKVEKKAETKGKQRAGKGEEVVKEKGETKEKGELKEKKREEEVKERRRVFEEIFDFGK